MASFLRKSLQVCCKAGPYFMFFLKIVRRSPGSHDKAIYDFFFVMPTSLTKFESFITW